MNYGKHSGGLFLNKVNIVQDYPTLASEFSLDLTATTWVIHSNEQAASLGHKPILWDSNFGLSCLNNFWLPNSNKRLRFYLKLFNTLSTSRKAAHCSTLGYNQVLFYITLFFSDRTGLYTTHSQQILPLKNISSISKTTFYLLLKIITLTARWDFCASLLYLISEVLCIK